MRIAILTLVIATAFFNSIAMAQTRFDSIVNFTKGIKASDINAAVAAAGTAQGTATALTRTINIVTSCTDGSADSVRLPLAEAGKVLVICNEGACGGASDLLVYPSTGDQINNGSTNASDELVDGACGLYVAADATDWFSIEQ